MKKIICIGSATKDFFLEISEGIVSDNPDDLTAQKLISFEFGAKIYAESFRQELGGSAVNVGTGLKACGFQPFIFSRSSSSDVGKWIQKQIGKRKLKKNYFQQTSGPESEVAVVISEQKHNDHVIFRTGDSVEKFDVGKALKKFKEKADWIYVGSQKKGWVSDMKKITKFAKNKKARIAINPSGYQITNNSKELLSFFGECEIVFMNKDESIEILMNAEHNTDDNIENIFYRMSGHCKNILVITDGANGAYASGKEGILHIPTQAVKIVDTVGAGDAFSSAFLASYAKDAEMEKALLWGIANSGSVVAKQGATNGLLKSKQLEKKAKELSGEVEHINGK